MTEPPSTRDTRKVESPGRDRQALGDRLVAHRRLIVSVAALVLLMAVGLLSTMEDALLGDRSDFDDPASTSAKARDVATKAAARSPEPELLLLVRPDEPLSSKPGKRQLETVVRKVRRHEGVAQVRVTLEGSEQGTSRTPRSALLTVYMTAAPPEEQDDVGRSVAESIERGYAVDVGGPIALNRDINETALKDVARIEAIVLPIVFLLLILVYRGLVAAALPVMIAVASIIAATAGLQVAARILPVSVFALNLVTALGLGLAIDYSLFVVSRFRSELAAHGSPRAATRNTIRTAGRTVAFSAGILMAAMTTLLLFPQRFLYSMGIGGILSTALAAVMAVLVLPALLSMLGTRVNALSIGRWRRLNKESSGQSAWWSRAAERVMRTPRAAALIAVLILLFLTLPATQITFIGVDESILPADSDAQRVSRFIAERYPDVPRSESFAMVETGRRDLPKVTRYAEGLRRGPGVLSVPQPEYLGEGVWKVTVHHKHRSLHPVTIRAVEEFREAPKPHSTSIGGLTAAFLDEEDSIARHLPPVIAALIVLTFALLLAMTRAPVVAAKTLLMTAMSLAATLGVLALVFDQTVLNGVFPTAVEPGLDLTQPVLVAIIAFGLSTDYGVFLLSRIIEAQRKGASDREAIRIGLATTGRVITAAAMLFCVAVGALAVSRLSLLRELGVGLAAAVLIDATLIRAILVPSLMVMLGKWNWWVPRTGLQSRQTSDGR